MLVQELADRTVDFAGAFSTAAFTDSFRLACAADIVVVVENEYALVRAEGVLEEARGGHA